MCRLSETWVITIVIIIVVATIIVAMTSAAAALCGFQRLAIGQGLNYKSEKDVRTHSDRHIRKGR